MSGRGGKKKWKKFLCISRRKFPKIPGNSWEGFPNVTSGFALRLATSERDPDNNVRPNMKFTIKIIDL